MSWSKTVTVLRQSRITITSSMTYPLPLTCVHYHYPQHEKMFERPMRRVREANIELCNYSQSESIPFTDTLHQVWSYYGHGNTFECLINKVVSFETFGLTLPLYYNKLFLDTLIPMSSYNP